MAKVEKTNYPGRLVPATKVAFEHEGKKYLLIRRPPSWHSCEDCSFFSGTRGLGVCPGITSGAYRDMLDGRAVACASAGKIFVEDNAENRVLATIDRMTP